MLENPCPVGLVISMSVGTQAARGRFPVSSTFLVFLQDKPFFVLATNCFPLIPFAFLTY